MPEPEVIQIDGLREFNRRLRRIDRDLPKGLRLAGNAAADLIVRQAKPLVPRASGRAAATVRAKSTRTAARIAAGGKRAPYYPWLDFGGKVGIDRSVDRPFLRTGRYIWRAYADQRPEVEETMRAELEKVAASAGLGVD